MQYSANVTFFLMHLIGKRWIIVGTQLYVKNPRTRFFFSNVQDSRSEGGGDTLNETIIHSDSSFSLICTPTVGEHPSPTQTPTLSLWATDAELFVLKETTLLLTEKKVVFVKYSAAEAEV